MGGKNMGLGFMVLPLATAALLSTMAMPLVAAPVVPADANGLSTPDNSVGAAPPGTKPSSLIEGASVSEVPNQSKTIEMLLEMQGKNPGLAAGERPRQEMPAGGRAASSPIASTPAKPFGVDDPANPFGGPGLAANKAGTTPQDSAVSWTQAPTSPFGAGDLSSSGTAQREYPGRPATAGSSSDEDEVRWLIPRSVVRFVRQNREMVVIGSVVVLLLLWGATALASSRRK
jgi:hypothetical protein